MQKLFNYFNSRVIKNDQPESCWIWSGYARDGIGMAIVGNKNLSAHRLSWILHKGEIGVKQQILRECKNNLCVNPEHLYIGGLFYEKKCKVCGKNYEVRKRLFKTSSCCSKHCASKNAGTMTRKKQLEAWSKDTSEQVRYKMQQSFEKYINKTKSCWVWTAAIKDKSKLHYGNFRFRGKSYIAHRASYIIYKGEIPKGLLVLHSCDNPQCVNPDHLHLGTHLDNQREKLARGRCKIEKLSIEQVKKIKEKFNMGVKGSRIAKDYNISQSTASSIKLNKTWKDIIV